MLGSGEVACKNSRPGMEIIFKSKKKKKKKNNKKKKIYIYIYIYTVYIYNTRSVVYSCAHLMKYVYDMYIIFTFTTLYCIYKVVLLLE